MKGRGEFVWLSGEQRNVLYKIAKDTGKGKSRVLREAFLVFMEKSAQDFVEECMLDRKLKRLEKESKQLRRVQSLILRDRAYLRGYVDKVMKGEWTIDGMSGRRRPPLPETPGAALSARALEGIFARRAEIGRQAAELAVKRWPGSYMVGATPIPKGFQTGFLRWPECPYWILSRYNKNFGGPPDRKWCDQHNKEVSVERCMGCWEKGMKVQVEEDPDWDVWRRSQEDWRRRLWEDQFEFDENLRSLRDEGRSVATLKKPKSSETQKKRQTRLGSCASRGQAD